MNNGPSTSNYCILFLFEWKPNIITCKTPFQSSQRKDLYYWSHLQLIPWLIPFLLSWQGLTDRKTKEGILICIICSCIYLAAASSAQLSWWRNVVVVEFPEVGARLGSQAETKQNMAEIIGQVDGLGLGLVLILVLGLLLLLPHVPR